MTTNPYSEHDKKILREFREIFGHVFDITDKLAEKQGMRILGDSKLTFQVWLKTILRDRDKLNRKLYNSIQDIDWEKYYPGRYFKQFMEFNIAKKKGLKTLHIGPGYVCMPTKMYNELTKTGKIKTRY